MGQLRSPSPEMGVRLPLYCLGKPGAQYRFVLSLHLNSSLDFMEICQLITASIKCHLSLCPTASQSIHRFVRGCLWRESFDTCVDLRQRCFCIAGMGLSWSPSTSSWMYVFVELGGEPCPSPGPSRLCFCSVLSCCITCPYFTLRIVLNHPYFQELRP